MGLLQSAWEGSKPQFVLMIMVTVGLFSLLTMMIFHDVPTANKDLVNIVLGAVTAGWGVGVSYFWGSSSASKSKDDTISALVTTAAAIAPATTVTTTTSTEKLPLSDPPKEPTP